MGPGAPEPGVVDATGLGSPVGSRSWHDGGVSTATTDPPGPDAEPQPSDPGGIRASGPAPEEAGERRRSALQKSVADMLRSLLVILAIVAVIVLLVPRPSSVPQQDVDVAAAAAGAEPVLGFRPAVPQVPQGWTPTSAEPRRGGDGIMTWHVGYLTPTGRYAGVEQAERSTFGWQNALTSGGEPVGTVTVAGRSWEHLYREDRDVTSLILRLPGRVTLVTSKQGGVPDASALAAAVPASALTGDPAAPGSSTGPSATPSATGP